MERLGAVDRMHRLPDGRRLAYAERGVDGGDVVVHLHGLAGSPLPADPWIEALLAELDVRLLTVHRAGFGLSDATRHPGLAGAAADLDSLLRAVGAYEGVRLLGVSAGGPHALAAAGLLGAHRITAVAVVSCPGPARLRHLRPALPSLLGHLPGPLADDVRALARPWPTAPRDVPCPVDVWHGEHDRLVPLAEARDLAAALPHGRMRVIGGATHFFLRRLLPDVLRTLVRREAPSSGWRSAPAREAAAAPAAPLASPAAAGPPRARPS